MLTDVPIPPLTQKQLDLAKELGLNVETILPGREQLGVYMGHLNCEHYFEDGWLKGYGDKTLSWDDVEAGRCTLEEVLEDQQEAFGRYGVADTIEQILAHHADLVNHPERRYVIKVTPIFREHQPKRDGWRWHKWGEYIGTQEQRHEYLYDETHIDHVLAYKVFGVKGGQT